MTAVDASIEMIAINRAKLGRDASRVTFQIADIFEWNPTSSFDAAIFCFWISHVPSTRLDAFLEKVASSVREGGQIFFVDGQREPAVMASDQVLPEANSEYMTRRLNDGREYQIVKNYYQPESLTDRFSRHGLAVEVRETATSFIYGFGRKMASPS